MGRRTRIGGRRVFSWGISAYVKAAGKQVQKTWPLGSDPDVINAWAIEARRKLKAARPETGTLAADIAKFLARLPEGRYKTNMTIELGKWAALPLGQRSRANLTRDDVIDALDKWRAEGYAGNTLRHFRQALITLYRQLDGRAHRCPALDVEQPAVASPRQGFFEAHMIDRVLAQLPEHYADVVRFAAFSGWRRSEIEGLQWSEIDEAGGVVRLPPERSKNRDGRVLPIVGPIKEVLERRSVYRRHSPLVFTRYVKRRNAYIPVGHWRKAWAKATKAAGCPGAILHDFRRTAVRNLIRARVPERVAMQFTGHKTRAIFDRYTIIRESDLQEAGAQMAQHLAGNGQGNS